MTTLRLEKLKEGMLLEQDVKDFQGRTLLTKGTQLTSRSIKNLKAWGVTEAHISEDASNSGNGNPTLEIDPEVLSSAKKEMKELFKHSNPDNSAIKELQRLYIFKKIKQNSKASPQ